ncbi:hypothetical protein [Streptomyces sp. NPDC088752]|uniref:hypothetical protein n=1 Tax=Streptomyces sp. NPDC088752 TaxID=3154963 RepID=UPI00341F1387
MSKRERFCHKTAYVSKDLAEWARPFREEKLGVPLKSYLCRSQVCRPYKWWHHTTKVSATDAPARRARKLKQQKEARRRRRYQVLRALPLQTWEDDGGAIV